MRPVMCWMSAGLTLYKGQLQVEIVPLGLLQTFHEPESWLFSFLAFVFGDFREKRPRGFLSRSAGEEPSMFFGPSK